jgi:hypothetical protein
VDVYRLRDFPKARTRQCPSPSDLRIRRFILKLCSERFEAVGERFCAFDKRRIRHSRSGCFRSLLDQLVGEEQRCEEELAGFAQRPESREGFAALTVDEARGGAEILLFSLSTGNLINAANYRNVD